jgi:hypothetical protein
MSVPHNTVAHLQILNLYAAYCFTFDADDAEDWAQCFAPDGVLEIVRNDLGDTSPLDRVLRLDGREALVAWRRELPKGRRHHNVNVWVKSIEGDRARCGAYLLGVAADGVPSRRGHSVDELAQCSDGEWRFARREVHVPEGAISLPAPA